MDQVNQLLKALGPSGKSLAITAIVVFVVSIVLSPGVLFEIQPTETPKVKKENKVKTLTAVTHSLIMAVIVTLFVYVYFVKAQSNNANVSSSSLK